MVANVEIGGPFKVLAQQIWIKADNRKPPALGEAIAPTVVQAGSSDTDSAPVNLINGSGLRDFDFDDLSEHRANTAFMWRSAKGDTKDWLEFDFGSPQKLSTICVWNYNDTWHTNMGVQKMTISVWTSEAGWQKIRESQPIDLAEGGDGYDEPTIIKLEGTTTAQKIRFDALTNFGDPDYTGLSEVQFFGPAGPVAARLYPPNGAEGVGVNGLELTWVPGQGAKAHKVYLGTSPDNLKPVGEVEQIGVKVASLKCDAKYYWRVDEVQTDGSLVSGKISDFTTGGLAAWWRLDESDGLKAVDSLGSRHDGAIHGDPQWRPQGGKISGALQFDGMDDYVDTGWADNLATWTVAVWVKSPSAPAGTPVPSGPVHRQANYQINWNHHTAEHRGDTGLRIGSTWHHASFGGLDPDTWYHLVGTFDGRSLKAYKDGVLVTENSRASGRPAHEPATLKIGRHATDEGYFAGTVDNVCIFTYALSAEEVKALYSGQEPTALAAGTISSPPGPVSQR